MDKKESKELIVVRLVDGKDIDVQINTKFLPMVAFAKEIIGFKLASALATEELAQKVKAEEKKPNKLIVPNNGGYKGNLRNFLRRK